MKPSSSKYGQYYDKEFVQQHAVLFQRQALWAKQVLDDELAKPMDVRDHSIVNQAIKDIKWNEQKFAEAYQRT